MIHSLFQQALALKSVDNRNCGPVPPAAELAEITVPGRNVAGSGLFARSHSLRIAPPVSGWLAVNVQLNKTGRERGDAQVR